MSPLFVVDVVVKMISSTVTFKSNKSGSLKLTFPRREWNYHGTVTDILNTILAEEVNPICVNDKKDANVLDFNRERETFKEKILANYKMGNSDFNLKHYSQFHSFEIIIAEPRDSNDSVKESSQFIDAGIINEGKRKFTGVTGDIKIEAGGLLFDRPGTDWGSVNKLFIQLPIFKLGDLSTVINHSRGIGASLVNRTLKLKEDLLVNKPILDEAVKMQKGLPYVITYMLASMCSDCVYGTKSTDFGPFTITVNLSLC